MAFLTIKGTPYEVVAQGASEGTPERIGSSRRDYNGGTRSTVKDEKRNWTFPLAPMTEAEWLVLYADTRLAAQVVCAGDALPVGGVTCEVEITANDYVKDVTEPTDYRRAVTVKLNQV